MSPFSKLIPQALCCFPVLPHNEEPQQQSPIRRIPLVVPRKPTPYAMINVPNEPEMTDMQAFRRIFTQSPACPHGATPTERKEKRSNHPPAKRSLDLAYTFNSGSPVPPLKSSTSLQKLHNHIKQKISESKLSKGSSREKNVEKRVEEEDRCMSDPSASSEAIALGASARSTGLSDLLRSRNGSGDGYDSDAESIKTPKLGDIASIIKTSPEVARRSPNELELLPEDSMSNHRLTPKPAIAPSQIYLIQTASQSQAPQMPDKTPTSDALQMKPSDSTSVALRNLSAATATATVQCSTTDELCNFRIPTFHDHEDDQYPSLQIPQRSSSLDKEASAPPITVRSLSEQTGHDNRTGTQTGSSDGRVATPLDQFSSACVERLSRSSSTIFSEPALDAASPRTAIRGTVPQPVIQPNDEGELIASQMTSLGQSSADVTSLISNATSEEQSVHLFNMQISRRLASKSTATMLSPAHSENASRKSLEKIPPLPALTHIMSIATGPYPANPKAEHDRRPSDPYTRRLFERSPQAKFPHIKPRSTSINRPQVPSHDRDDASSCYTDGGGPASSAGNLSTLDGTTAHAPTRNPNSLAIGGRSASNVIPLQRSIDTAQNKSRPHELPQESLSTSIDRGLSRLDVASDVINRYIDDNFEAAQHKCDSDLGQTSGNPPQTQSQLQRSIRVSENVQPSKTAELDICESSARRVSPGWLTAGQRSGWNYKFVNEATLAKRRESNDSGIAPEVNPSPSPLAESATDMWNRAYRNAREENGGRDLLATSLIEMDDIRRCSSASTMRLKHRPSVAILTPKVVLRKSISAGPHARQVLRNDDSTASRLPKRLERLSFLNRRSSRHQLTPGAGPRKLRKRSSPELSKKSSSLASHDTRMRSFRAGHTPPLKELLGIWGSFPSHTRAERNGLAGTSDNVLGRDFGLCNNDYQKGDGSPTPLVTRASTGALSAMHSTLKMISMRSRKLDVKRTKSMSLPVTPRDRVQKYPKTFLSSKRKHLLRTTSSERRGEMVSDGQEINLSDARPVGYSELEGSPGEGMFVTPQSSTINAPRVDGAASARDTPRRTDHSTTQFAGDINSTPTHFFETESRPSIQSTVKSQSSILQPGTPSIMNDDAPARTKTSLERSVQEKIHQYNLHSMSDKVQTIPSRPTSRQRPSRPSAVSRESRDFKIPGSFE